MSRLAKKPIEIPAKVEVKQTGNMVLVKGPKGHIEVDINPGVRIELLEGKLFVKEDLGLVHRPYLGLVRSRLQNAVVGVTQGYEKKLDLVGIGFKAALKGNAIDFSLGFSHPLQMEIPKGLEVKIDKNVAIMISGVDKQLVGQFSATIRSLKPPEPYKGKGIRYQGEVVRKKAGKTAK